MQGPKRWGWGEKVFPIIRDGAGMGQDKTTRGGDEDPILRPHLALLPSLFQINWILKKSVSWKVSWVKNICFYSLFIYKVIYKIPTENFICVENLNFILRSHTKMIRIKYLYFFLVLYIMLYIVVQKIIINTIKYLTHLRIEKCIY